MCSFLSRIPFASLRNTSSKCFPLNNLFKPAVQTSEKILKRNGFIALCSDLTIRCFTTDPSHHPTTIDSASLPLKKKTIHKKPTVSDLSIKEGQYLTLAYATANSYDIQGLREALLEQKLYQPGTLKAHAIGDDVLVATAVYTVGDEPRQIIFFREGAVVFWNCSELEASNVLEFLKKYEIESYPQEVVEREKEIMTYFYTGSVKKCHLQDSTFVLVKGRDNSLEKYTFSHAMVQSARLGAWEMRLEALAASVRAHTALMERDGVAYLDKKEVVRKLGELFSLRHRLNVESDILDTPDFYWEEEQLERLYSNTVSYFTIPRRTRVLNERLSHCVELLELLSSWAADKHHVRLEWMVIALILAEVCFEILHLVERYVTRNPVQEIHDMVRQDRRPRPRLFDSEDHVFPDLSIIDT